MTGLDSPYEPPLKPEVVLDSEREDPSRCVFELIRSLEDKRYLALRK